jgi:peroxiredoxin
MPSFELKDPNGKLYRGEEQYGQHGLLVAFTCNHCPYALAVWPRLLRLAEYAGKLGIKTVAINPNIHPGYPEDSPESMLEKTKEWGIRFPYLVDETQETARNFRAQCTPDIYLFNQARELVYHGRIDDNWQDERKVTREELKEAIAALAKGQPTATKQNPSLGCSIKWRE